MIGGTGVVVPGMNPSESNSFLLVEAVPTTLNATGLRVDDVRVERELVTAVPHVAEILELAVAQSE